MPARFSFPVSWPLVRYVLTAALRDRLVVSLLGMVAVGASIGVFLGSSAVIEANQFALVFASGGLRLAGVAGLVLFVVFYVRRAFDSRDVDFLLSRPVSRVSFIGSHAAAFSLMAVVMAAVIVCAILLAAPRATESAGLLLWGLSLTVELVIMANAALFFSMVLPSAVSGTLATFGLYVLARLMGDILGILHEGVMMPGFDILSLAMKTVSLIVPRLDLMAQTSWLVYGPGVDVDVWFILAQGGAYTFLLVMAALVDMLRRQF